MYGYLVTGQDLNKVHSELAGNGGQNGVAVADVYLEHCVGQVIGNDTLDLNYVVFCQVINLLGHYFAVPGFAGVLRNSKFGDGEYFRLPVGDEYSIFIVCR